MAWVYKGCSVQSVPSWSNVAIRSAGGTNFGLDLSVVARTNSRMAFFAAPSFHEGNGFSAAIDTRLTDPKTAIAADDLITSLRVIFINSPVRRNVRLTTGKLCWSHRAHN